MRASRAGSNCCFKAPRRISKVHAAPMADFSCSQNPRVTWILCTSMYQWPTFSRANGYQSGKRTIFAPFLPYLCTNGRLCTYVESTCYVGSARDHVPMADFFTSPPFNHPGRARISGPPEDVSCQDGGHLGAGITCRSPTSDIDRCQRDRSNTTSCAWARSARYSSAAIGAGLVWLDPQNEGSAMSETRSQPLRCPDPRIPGPANRLPR